MIVVSNKKLPFDVLAFTRYNEKAYYVPPGTIPTSVSQETGKSPSGEEWYPNILPFGRLTAFIPGNPGAGKSYFANELINILPEDFNVLLFTALDEDDGNFKELKKEGRLYKIRMVPEVLSQMTLSAIRERTDNAILLFDDVDKIRDKEVSRLTFQILEDALANGRGHMKHDGAGDLHVIATSHTMNDYKKTKYTLENSDYVVVFPQSSTYAQMKLLFSKLGLSKDLCDEVVRAGKLGVRRVVIKKTAPMYIIIGDTISLI